MKIIFIGTPQFAVPSLERLLGDPRFEVAAVVTQPDKRRGRGKKLIPSPVKAIALAQGLPIWQPHRLKKDAQVFSQLQQVGADAFLVVAYGQILPQRILDLPRLGCINVHGSLLPQYRGAAPIQWSLYHGNPSTGVTTMLMDAGMDTGPMLLKSESAVGLLDNAHDVAGRLADSGAALLVETLLQLEAGSVQPIAQANDQATYAPLIQRADYGLDWSRPAIALHNQIRGFYPNCNATFRGTSLKLSATLPLNADCWEQLPDSFRALEQQWSDWSNSAKTAAPGTVVSIAKKHGPAIQTGEGLLLLRSLQLAGKRSQSGWDFANGTRLSIGEIIENGEQ